MLIKILGVDLGKLSCHVIGQDQYEKVVEKRKMLISKHVWCQVLHFAPKFT
ncbi:hypothetical protein JAMGFMIE_01275 [Rheinheimera sp. MM224]|nr:hypothetical protein JAMGFMIE_01275 [Rheinheimera sp. MM224]